MKILLKILVAPFALALSLLAALLVFLFDICAVLLTIASVILAVLGVALFFTPTPIGGIVYLIPCFDQRTGRERRHPHAERSLPQLCRKSGLGDRQGIFRKRRFRLQKICQRA